MTKGRHDKRSQTAGQGTSGLHQNQVFRQGTTNKRIKLTSQQNVVVAALLRAYGDSSFRLFCQH